MSLSSYMYTLHVAISSNNPKELKERSFKEWLSYIEPLKRPGFPFRIDSLQLNRSYEFYPFWLISSISLNSWPQFLEYKFVEIEESESPFGITSDGNKKIFSRIIGASYVNYYESQKENIDDKFGTNPQEWPDTINIARHIRNGFSHGGTFYITNSNTDELEWRNLKLDYSMHNDEVLFQNGLGPGDIILFMDDLDQLL